MSMRCSFSSACLCLVALVLLGTLTNLIRKVSAASVLVSTELLLCPYSEDLDDQGQDQYETRALFVVSTKWCQAYQLPRKLVQEAWMGSACNSLETKSCYSILAAKVRKAAHVKQLRVLDSSPSICR
eukprot:4822878-Amphidinium_carterae.1